MVALLMQTCSAAIRYYQQGHGTKKCRIYPCGRGLCFRIHAREV